MTDALPVPFEKSYWVIPGRFLAVQYPGGFSEQATRARLEELARAGITMLIDLTEPAESQLFPYENLLGEVYGRSVRLRHIRFSIADGEAPSQALMQSALTAIDEALSLGEGVYLHCQGGSGRTGTVVGCYLVQQGLTAEQALAQIEQWRRPGWRSASGQSPETEEQRQFIRTWAENHPG